MKRQVAMIISIAVISSLFGILFFNMNSGAISISELQTDVQSMNETIQSLNQTIESLEAHKQNKVILRMNFEPQTSELPFEQWFDILTVKDVLVWEGACVVTIATIDFYEPQGSLIVRHRANDTYGEMHEIESVTVDFVELHHTWIIPQAGIYTFGIQGLRESVETVTVWKSRLTLIIV